MDKLKSLLVSRKFWAALMGLVMILIKAYRPDFPLAEGQVTDLVVVLAAYILGTGLEQAPAKPALAARFYVPARRKDE